LDGPQEVSQLHFIPTRIDLAHVVSQIKVVEGTKKGPTPKMIKKIMPNFMHLF
jgi:hypothetical protein